MKTIFRDGTNFVAAIETKSEDEAWICILALCRGEDLPEHVRILGKNERYPGFVNQHPEVQLDELQTILSAQEPRSAPENPLMQGKCAYCNANDAEVPDGDHVIARGFFPEHQRTNEIVFIRVPVCHPCNGKKSGLEQDMMAYFQINDGAEKTGIATLFQGENSAIERAIKDGHRPWPRIIAGITRLFLGHPDGTIEETGHTDLNFGIADRFFEFVIKGLYYYYTKNHFPVEWSVYEARLFPQALDARLARLQTQPTYQHVNLGGDIFDCHFALPDGLQPTSYWMCSWYANSMLFWAMTDRAPATGELLQPRQEQSGLDAAVFVRLDLQEAVLRRVLDNSGQLQIDPDDFRIAKHKLAAYKPTGKLYQL